MEEAVYLLTRQEAAKRYGISLRMLDNLYRFNRDFPIIRVGHRVLIHRERADKWFTEAVGETIDTEVVRRCSGRKSYQ